MTAGVASHLLGSLCAICPHDLILSISTLLYKVFAIFAIAIFAIVAPGIDLIYNGKTHNNEVKLKVSYSNL
jgi:hypothetical protein